MVNLLKYCSNNFYVLFCAVLLPCEPQNILQIACELSCRDMPKQGLCWFLSSPQCNGPALYFGADVAGRYSTEDLGCSVRTGPDCSKSPPLLVVLR